MKTGASWLVLLLLSAAPGYAQASKRPNILVIMTDDQTHDTATPEFMPNTRSMIGNQGLVCPNFLVSTSLCCPSRASFLTGKYAHNNGVYGNRDNLIGPTVVNDLHNAGYYTGLSGKYLNTWPGGLRPEFDFWVAWIQGYNDPILNIQGKAARVPGYSTYLLRDQALTFLDKVPPDRPFFLLFAPHAPHKPATPAPGDEKLYPNLPPWRPPSFNPESQADKPEWLANKTRLDQRQIRQNVDVFRANQIRCLHSVDNSVRDILNKLKQEQKLDNTFVIYYSDNGYFWGEHRLLHKNRVYEEANRVPLQIRYPPLIKEPRTEDKLMAVIDFAPTFYELAGMPVPKECDGRSLLPLLIGAKDWRTGVLLEGWIVTHLDKESAEEREEEADSAPAAQTRSSPPPITPESYRAIRTDDFIYVETVGDRSELYDLRNDPWQMHNLINKSEYADKIKELRERLRHEKL